MKRFMTLAMVAMMLLSSVNFASAAEVTFPDVAGSWCESYVKDLAAKSIVGGYADGTYKPEATVTRGAIAKMVLTAMQSCGSTIAPSTNGTALKGTTWSAQYVTPLAGQGIIVASEYPNGYNESTAMTRLEVAKMLVRTYLYAHSDEELAAAATLTFADADKISASDAPYVQKAVELGIINGYKDANGNTLFGPEGSIKRSTAAAMIDRSLEKLGTISDTVIAMAPTGSVSLDTSKAPEIQGVEWVVAPTIKLDFEDKTWRAPLYFNETSKDGITAYWTTKDESNPTVVDLKTGKTYQFKGISKLGNFVNGIAPAQDISTKLYGYVDLTGSWVVKPTYDRADDYKLVYFKDGTTGYYGDVQKNDDWNAIDSNYQIALSDITENIPNIDFKKTYGVGANAVTNDPPTPKDGSEIVGNFTNSGLFTTCIHVDQSEGGNYFGICDKDGNVIVKAAAVHPYCDGVKSHDSYIGADVYDDCIVLLHKYTNAWDTLSDIYDGTTGELLYTYFGSREGTPFRAVRNYGQGVFAYCDRENYKDGDLNVLWGYMKKDGTNLTSMAFEEANPFSNGYAWVKYNGLWGIIAMPTI